MIAAWYDRQGPAADVLHVGELPTAEPGPGEVRVRLTLSGANPGDIKKRQAWLGSPMAFPRIIPHGDGAGVIEAAGPGAATARVGRRVWVYGAQSYRPFGTAAQTTVVPEALAVDLPDAVSDEIGACLGIPGITAHRAVFADGPVSGQIVLVHGVRGSVSSLAAQLARRAGATVIGTVRTDAEAGQVDPAAADQVISLASDPVAAIRRLAPDGVDRIVEVALSANAGLDAAVVRNGGVLAAYASPKDRPELPFWPMLFNNLTIRLLGSDDFPQAAKDATARDLTDAGAQSALSVTVAEVFPLQRIATAHELVESGKAAGRVLVSLAALAWRYLSRAATGSRLIAAIKSGGHKVTCANPVLGRRAGVPVPQHAGAARVPVPGVLRVRMCSAGYEGLAEVTDALNPAGQDLAGLEVAWRGPAHADARGRAGEDDIAGQQGQDGGQPSDEGGHRKDQLGRAAFLDLLAVDGAGQLEVVGVGELIRRDQPRAHGGEAWEGLGEAELGGRAGCLQDPLGDVLPDGQARDVRPRVALGDVMCALADDGDELHFPVDVAVWQFDLGAGAGDRGRELGEDGRGRRRGESGLAGVRAVVQADREQLLRRGRRRVERRRVVAGPGWHLRGGSPAAELVEAGVDGLDVGPEPPAGCLGDVDGPGAVDQGEASGEVGDAHGGAPWLVRLRRAGRRGPLCR
jgi:NADPH:quinone reductase